MSFMVVYTICVCVAAAAADRLFCYLNRRYSILQLTAIKIFPYWYKLVLKKYDYYDLVESARNLLPPGHLPPKVFLPPGPFCIPWDEDTIASWRLLPPGPFASRGNLPLGYLEISALFITAQATQKARLFQKLHFLLLPWVVITLSVL